MNYNFLKKVFSLFLVAVSVFTWIGISCFAAEQRLIELHQDEESDEYCMDIDQVDQIHDIKGHIDTNYYDDIIYYIDFGYYFIIVN